MKGKNVVITGGNAGIGLATSKALAKKGARVIIMSRTAERGNEAVEEVKAYAGHDNVEMLQCDLASQKQIRQAAEKLNELDRLDVLVNNAGAFFSEYAETEDGIERQFAVNHLAPFLLTNLVLDKIKASAPARIVTVSSRAHYRGDINFDNLGFKGEYDGFMKAYSQSKLANVLFTYELARKLEGSGVTATCLHPGVVGTSIAQKNSKGFYKLGWGLLKPFMTTTEKGAETSVYLASSPEAEGFTGQFFDKCKPRESSALSHDKELAKKLWDVSLEMTGLSN